jgi:hypothetical protein
MTDTLLRRRLSELISEFTTSALAAVRAGSIEDLQEETGRAPRASGGMRESGARGGRPRRVSRRSPKISRVRTSRGGSKRAFGAAERKLRAAMAHADDPLQRYATGEIISVVKQNPDRYGDGAVSLLAAAIGETTPRLYRFAKVAEAWSRAEVRQLLAQGVTWSHLVALVWHAEPKDRASWLVRIKREGLSVRDLEIRLNR